MSATPRAAALSVAFFFSLAVSGSALAASCPSVGDPQGIKTAFPQQAEVSELGTMLTYSERPEFAARVAAGTLPPVEQRLPEDPLVVLPYVDCGTPPGSRWTGSL